MKKKIFTLLTVLFAVGFLVSGGLLAKYFIDSNQQAQVYNELADIMAQSSAQKEAPPVTVTDTQGETLEILPEFRELYEKNPDLAGWMQIAGTELNYPVMYKPDSKDFYLRKNFYGKKANHGCLYIQETCEVFPQSDNIVVFGHNMKDGSMFAPLKGYLKESFWEAHPVIRFDTLQERNEYEIFTVFTTTASVGKGFKFHNYIDITTEESFREFVDGCKALALYDTGIEPQFGDQFLCLATCEYTQTNGRLVVVARKIV